MQREQSGAVDVEFTVHDTGSGMSQTTVDALFRDFEQVSSEQESYYYDNDGVEEEPIDPLREK